MAGQRLAVVALALGAAGLAVAGCGGSGGGGGSIAAAAGVDFGVATGIKGTTTFQQSGRANDGSREAFPGQANQWDLDTDLSISDGGNDQFDNALLLQVNGSDFGPVTYGALVWSTPFLTPAQGVAALAVTNTGAGFTPLAGTYSANFASVAGGVTLQQTINLDGLTNSAVLRWQADVSDVDSTYFGDESGSFRVFIRAANGATLTGDISAQSAGFPITGTALTTQPITISFETKYSYLNNDRQGDDAVKVDAVSVTHTAGAELIVNGGFETGNTTGWTVTAGQHVQNVAATETKNSIRTTRCFFARPDTIWGRMIDTFENTSATAITVTASYKINLGSDGEGFIRFAPNTLQEAISEWDGAGADRDAGLLFGAATTVTFTSETDFGDGNGNEDVVWTYTFSLQPSEEKSVAQFIVLPRDNTGGTATTITAVPVAVEAELLRIFQGVANSTEFSQGATQEQIDTIINY